MLLSVVSFAKNEQEIKDTLSLFASEKLHSSVRVIYVILASVIVDFSWALF